MGHNNPIRGEAGGNGPRTPPADAAGRGPSAARSPAAGEIPDKLYFRIGDVADICDLPAYVLRFWETEFPQLKPNKGGTGQRLYRRRDVEMALRIKWLLYDEGYTIPGARQLLKSESRQPAPQLSLLGPVPPDPRGLAKLRRELEAIHAMLSAPVGSRPGLRSIRGQRRAALEASAAKTVEPKPEPTSLRSLTSEIPFDPPESD